MYVRLNFFCAEADLYVMEGGRGAGLSNCFTYFVPSICMMTYVNLYIYIYIYHGSKKLILS